MLGRMGGECFMVVLERHPRLKREIKAKRETSWYHLLHLIILSTLSIFEIM